MRNKLFITMLVGIMVLTGCAKDTPQEEVPNNNEVVEGTTTAVSTTSTTGTTTSTTVENEIPNVIYSDIHPTYKADLSKDYNDLQKALVKQVRKEVFLPIVEEYKLFSKQDGAYFKGCSITKNPYKEGTCDDYLILLTDDTEIRFSLTIKNEKINNASSDNNSSSDNTTNNSNLSEEEKCTLDPNCTSPSEYAELYPIKGNDNYRGNYSEATTYVDDTIIKKIAGTIMEESDNSITIGMNDIYPLKISSMNHNPHNSKGHWNNNQAISILNKVNTNLHNGNVSNNKFNYNKSKAIKVDEHLYKFENSITWNKSQNISLTENDIQKMIDLAINSNNYMDKGQSFGVYTYKKINDLLIFEFQTNSEFNKIVGQDKNTGEQYIDYADNILWFNNAGIQKGTYKNIVIVDTKNVTAFSMTSGNIKENHNILFMTYYDGKNRMGISISDGAGQYFSVQNYATQQAQYSNPNLSALGNFFPESKSLKPNMGVTILDYAIANK